MADGKTPPTRHDARADELEERVAALEADESYSQRLSDIEDQLRRLEKAFTSQLGGRLD